MKIKFHAFFLCALIALFAASAAWAVDVNLVTDESDGSLYVNIPFNESANQATSLDEAANLTITMSDIAASTGSFTFKVYDDGGKNGNYSICPQSQSSCYNYLVITVPTGYVINLSGSLVTESATNPYDYLNVYNGATSDSPLLFENAHSQSTGENVSVGPFVSSSNAMMILWESDYSTVAAGLDLTVMVTREMSGDGTNGYYINMSSSGTDNVTITAADVAAGLTSFKVYDDGGSSGNYTRYSKSYLVINAPDGYVLSIGGEITAQSDDKLTIYDGSRYSEPLLSEFTSSYWYIARDIGGPYQSTGGTMTIFFNAKNYTGAAGFDLDVSLVEASGSHSITVSEGVGGSVVSDVSTASVGQMVYLTSTVADGYVLNKIMVLAGETPVDVIGGSWDTWNNASFRMPNADVTVSAEFVPVAEADFSIDMILNTTKKISVSGDVNSIKVYDNGGRTGTYSNSSSDYLEITVPEGYTMCITGSVATERYDRLSVYDGRTTDALLLNGFSSTNTGKRESIGTYFTSGNVATIYFTSDSYGAYDGLDLKVELGDADATHSVTIGTSNHGTLTSDVASRKPGETVTFTGTPNGGYIFTGVRILDSRGETVANIQSDGTSNSVSFQMRYDDVTVIPYFASKAIAFGEDGCLAEGWYFHYENNLLSQKAVVPEEGFDFNCWYSETEDLVNGGTVQGGLWAAVNSSSVSLTTDLDLGGYDESAGKCRMNFKPLNTNNFKGRVSTSVPIQVVKNFCYISTGDAGFLNSTNTYGEAGDVSFQNAYVVGNRAGVLAATVMNGFTLEEVYISGATVLGDIVGGFVGVSLGNSSFQVAYIEDATIKGRIVGGHVGQVASGYDLYEHSVGYSDSYGYRSDRRSAAKNLTVIVQNSEASETGDAYAGGLLGYGTLRGSYPWRNLFSVNITADASIGPAWNVYLGGYAGYLVNAYMDPRSVRLEDVSIVNESSSQNAYVGGFAGRIDGSNLTVERTAFKGSLSGGNYVGGFVGKMEKTDEYNVLNVHSSAFIGTIEGSGNDGDKVGYIVGEWSAIEDVPLVSSNDALYGNFHYGLDEVTVGVGGYTLEEWTAGSDNFYDNIRNERTTLPASGEMNLYKYRLSCATEEYDYDFFPAGGYDLAAGAPTDRIRNGVAAESDIRSNKFVALMNEFAYSDSNWVLSELVDGLPFLDLAFQHQHHSRFVEMALDPSLTLENKEDYGVYDYYYDFCNAAVTSGMVTFPEDDGGLPSTAISSARSINSLLGTHVENDEGNAVDLSVTPFSYRSVTFVAAAAKVYSVEYQYCIEDDDPEAMTCVDLDDVSDKTFLFLSQRVNEISNGDEMFATLVPYVVSLDNPTDPLSVRITYLNSENVDNGDAFSGDVTAMPTFATVIEDAMGYDDVAKIVIKYQSGGSLPQLTIENPTSAGFKYSIFAYNAAGELETFESSTVSGDDPVTASYGAALSLTEFAKKVGYVYDSYALSYSVYSPNCSEHVVYEFEATGNNFASYGKLSAPAAYCDKNVWTISDIKDDKVYLEDVMLSRQNWGTYASQYTSSFTVVPNYLPIPYNVALDFVVTDGGLELDFNDYAIFTTGYSDPGNPQNLEMENTDFPRFYGSNGYSNIVLLGWTLDESKANCIDGESCEIDSDEIFNSLTAGLITVAENAGLIVDNPADLDAPQTIRLYPVWQRNLSEGFHAVVLNDCVRHGTACYEYPIEFTLSQDISLNGSPVRLFATSGFIPVEYDDGDYIMGYGVNYNMLQGRVYPVDFTYEATPGFRVTSVTPPAEYNDEIGKIEIAEENPEISVDYSVLRYNVTLNLENIEDVYLGRSAELSMEMSYEEGKYKFPKIYGRYVDPENFLWYYGTLLWGVKTSDGYDGNEKEFDSWLVRQFEGNDYFVPAENANANASMTVFATEVDFDALNIGKDINVYAVDVEGNRLQNGASDYHGSVVLTQTYDNDAADIHASYSHASKLEEDNNGVYHSIPVPHFDDTLAFQVSVRPDPGYSMTIDPEFTFEENFGNIPMMEGDEVPWGYADETETTGVLNVQPRGMNNMAFKVRYSSLYYDIAFSRPTQESGVFVGNKVVDDVYQMNWFDGVWGVSAETVRAPALYNADGCRVGWKVSGRVVESRETTDIVSELPFMEESSDDEENPIVNTLEPDVEHTVPNECDGFYTLTLDVEGEGELYFVQKIGAEPAEEGDPEQTVIRHVFVSQDDESPLELTVPKVLDRDGNEVGVKLTVVAAPADGYVLSDLSYDILVNGNLMHSSEQDGAELNVIGNQNWHVKFEQYAPVYVTYNLSLDANDSSKVWLPADAALSGSVQIAADGTPAKLWTPYRSDKCFAGWRNALMEEGDVFDEVSMTNHAEFSTNAARPTSLIADWVDYDDECSEPTTSTIVFGKQENAVVSYMTNGDTLVVRQLLGNRVFTHKSWISDNTQQGDELVFGVNEEGYDMSFEFIPGVGVETDPENLGAVVSNPSMDSPVAESDGQFRLAAPWGSFYVSFSEVKTSYEVVLSANAGGDVVVYGEHWNTVSTLQVENSLPVGSVFRAGACFKGWSFDPAYAESDVDFLKVSSSMLALRKQRVEAGLNADTLYAIWDDNSDCRTGTLALALDEEISGLVTVSFYQQLDETDSLVFQMSGNTTVTLPSGTNSYGEGSDTRIEDNVSFSHVEVTPKPGVSLSEEYTVAYVNQSDVEQVEHTLPIVANGTGVVFDDDATIKILGFSSNTYTVTFDANGGSADVFYPSDWPEDASVSYNVAMEESDRQFPKVYRTDKCLVGYGFSKDASRAESFAVFDTNFVKSYDSVVVAGVENPVLYGVWNECAETQTLYTVTLKEPVEGRLTLSQHGNSYDVPTTGFRVPAAPSGIPFTLSFALNDGYKFDETGLFNEVDAAGEIVGVLEDNVLVVDGDKIVDAPAEPKPYTFAFDVNVDAGENVFYGDGWKSSDNYALATEAIPFPTEVYRVGACLSGWKIDKESETEYTEYSDVFVAAVEKARQAGLPASTLYANWGPCATAQTIVTVANADALAGTFTLARTVSNETTEYTVGNATLEVPADVPLSFNVSFAVNKGYTYNALNGISAVDAAETPVEIDEGVLNVATSLTLSAAVYADTYIFVLDENAGDANVFYTGDLVTRFTAQMTDDETTRTLPKNLYRADACFVGWNFSDTATEGFELLDESLITAFEDAGTGTLYAVWNTSCLQSVYTVTSADKNYGSLTLSQSDGRSFEVGDGLLVPATTEGIVLTASFVPATGYAFDETAGFNAFSSMSNDLGLLENATATVRQSMSIKANGLAASEYSITFNLNAGDAVVYYGTPANGANPKHVYSLAGTESFPVDFYRVDSCLVGWRTTAEAVDGETVYTGLVPQLITTFMGNTSATLYAVWNACTVTNNVTVAQFAPEMGTLTLEQRDSTGAVLNSTIVADDAVSFPLGNGELEFTLGYSPAPGYSLDGGYYYQVNAAGNNIAPVVNGVFTLTANSILKAPAKFDSYEVVFDVNAGTSQKFFGNNWFASGEFNVAQNETARVFPTAVYREGYKLVGWSVEQLGDDEAAIQELPDGTSGYAGVYTAFDENLAELLSRTQRTTLHGVWVSDPNQTLYTVTLFNSDVGTVTLSQTVEGYSTQLSLGTAPIKVPAVDGGIRFAASATLKEGYFADGDDLYLVTSEGSRLGTLANGLLLVNEDRVVEIPVESDGIQIVFSTNTESIVFYEDDWQSAGSFSFDGETEFPKSLLRTDATLLGWTLSRSSSKYYNYYDADFVSDLRRSRSIGLPVDTLYAVWLEYGTFENVTVTAGNEKNGTFYISQTVNGKETAPIEVVKGGVEIPKSSKLTFNVSLDLNSGYYLPVEDALQNQATDGNTLDRSGNGGAMHLGAVNSTLRADVAATRYTFAYNVNAAGVNVFYGDSWSSHEEKTVDDEMHELQRNIYRADARLVGWSTDSTAKVGSFDVTSEFVQDIEQEHMTLYAVWEPAEVETYKVTFANTNVGSLVLTQDVEDSTVAFNVPVAGLDVPVVEDGLHFKAAYTLNAGYSGSTDSLYRIDDLGEIIANLSSGELTVDQDVTLAIPTSGESYKIVFNVNRENEILFYGNDWIDSRTYMMTADSSSFPLPAYLYTADACMVGWSLTKKGDGKLYTEFSSDLVEELQVREPVDSAYTLYAVWGNGSACDGAYNRISLQSANGSVRLVEAATLKSESPVEHIFAIDNTIILPKVMSGNMLHVVSLPDSSYVLDSLVTLRLGGEEHLATFEGGTLPFDLSEASLVAYFGKSNRSAIAFVDTAFAKTGNAVQFKFTTSEFEVTRGVSARIILETTAGEVIAKETLSDSIVPPYKGVWERFPLAAGQYVLTAVLSDEKETVEYVREFEVTAEIAAVSADGWQMISIGNLDKKALTWDGDQKFFWWDEASAFGEFWQYKELTKKGKIDPTRGYWYSSIEGRTLALKPDPGEKRETVVWSLDSVNSGWNLVANPVGFALDIYGDHPAEKSNVTFWRWNAEIADYEKTDVLDAYEAVWAKVSGPTEWTVPVRPQFQSGDSTESNGVEPLGKSARLAKANGTSDWRLQMVLSDAAGHRDSWNVLGVSRNPFASEEPPEGMGNHVKLAVLDGTRLLAESVRAPDEEQEWTISLNANSDRIGELSFRGASELNAYGLNVYVTVDGRTVEVRDDSPVRVALKSSATQALVRVAPSAKVVAGGQIEALRALQSGRSLNVTFDVSENLNGVRTMVDLVNMDGHVVATRSLSAMAGVNQVALEAPKSGVYMLRVRAGNQMRAGRIMVK